MTNRTLFLTIIAFISLHLFAGVNVGIIPDRYQELTEELERGAVDSLRFVEIKEIMQKDFPDTKTSFELVSNEFYELINPIWTNDSLKVVVLGEMLEKYPTNNWRRTIYQYYTYSLANLKQKDKIIEVLKDFRRAYPDDYLSWYLSAYYYNGLEIDSLKALNYAEKAYSKSLDYPKLRYYQEMEWDLEKRSAPLKTASVYANLLIKNNRDKDAEKLLKKAIKESPLTVDDETTLAQCYYMLAKLYDKQNKAKSCLHSALKCLMAGDSRNIYAPLADSLFRKHTKLTDADNNTVIKTARKQAKYKGVKFHDATEEFGLKDVSASRVAFADYDKDGFADMLLNNGHLYRNLNGKGFEDVTVSAFTEKFNSGGSLWADLDNDGDLDIITKDPEAVWLNNAGLFSKLTPDFGIADNGISTEGMGIGDVDGDGFPDVYFANYEVWTGTSSEPFADQFFHNSGGGRFEDWTEKAGLIPEDGKPMAGRGVNFGDFDNDGDLDIYVSNYRLQENFLWQNDGTGHFVDVSTEKGVKGVNTDGWFGHTIGSQWGDMDNDGDLDLICANLAHPRYIDFSNKTMLYYNNGSPDFTFTEKRAEKGIVFEETHSEPLLGDFDNDGRLDIFFNCVYEGRRSFLYMQQKDGSFKDETYLAGVRHFNGWGAASADVDNDGKLDFVACGGKIQLFINESEDENKWLEVEIKPSSNADAIGTRITLSGKNGTYIREIEGGKGTTNQSNLVQHFGLGKENNLTLEVSFLDGKTITQEIKKTNDRIIINYD
ncbi:MAG: VCBS repeat-containing protein [Candidatus Cloacimonetes bacterium]|nr:VCBS repeat-containing protein [Candidatus Cloacimonadota bacterium]